MSEHGRAIVVDTGGMGDMDIGAFFRNQALVTGAMASLKKSLGALKRELDQVAAGFGRAAKAAGEVLSTLMRTSSVTAGLEGGMANLYKYAKQYGKALAGSLDAASASAQYLRNSLAALAAPLIQSVAPAVDYIADKFVSLFNLINQLFARLAGSDTYIAARRFGDAWSNESNRAVNAVSSVRRYLMGFDELNVLGGGSGGGGSGGGGGGYGAMFEEREIEGGIAGFADRLLEAVRASDWEALGAMLGGLINDAIDGIDWQALGAKVGGYLNGAIRTAHSLLDSVNFTGIGQSIAAFLDSALGEIDFGKAGATVALFFSSAVETFAGFVGSFDWQQFAGKAAEAVNGFAAKLGEKLDAVDWAALTKKLVDGMNAFIRDVDWQALGEGLGHRISDLLAILGTAAEAFDWSGAGAALANGLNELFRSIDWKALGDWLSDALTGILDLGLAFFGELDVDALCEGIKTALERVDWDSVAKKLWQLFSLALSKLGQAANTLLFGGTTDLNVAIGLIKNGWTSISQFVGTLVTVVANLTQNGSNWAGGLLKWFMGVAGTNVVELVGKLTMRDDSAGWWSDIRGWFAAQAGNGWNRLTIAPEMQDVSGKWWDDIRGWFNAQAGNHWNRLYLTPEVQNASGAWWDDIRKWFAEQSGYFWNRLTLTPEVHNASGAWWENIRKWFAAQSGYLWNKLTLSPEVRDNSGSWWEDIRKWFNKGGKQSWNALTLSPEVRDNSGTWWDNIRKWFNKGGKQSWNELRMSAVMQDTSGTWWDNIRKWFNKQAGNWWNKLELTATVRNDSASWWANVVSWWNGVKQTLGFNVAAQGGSFASGGYVTDSGRMSAFGAGGAIANGGASWWDGARKYAAGTGRAHGTVFVAGEAGPEIVGHVNGRTEILNKSQLAQAMYGAVVGGMTQAVNALGRCLVNHMTACTNAVVGTIGGVASMSGVAYHAPALATGAVVPYEISAQIAKCGADIQDTLDANNEDLIQTIVSVAGQIVSAVNGLQGARQTSGAGGLTARQVIGEINRRTQMFGVNPLEGI